MVCDGHVKYEKAEVDRSAIMKHFRGDQRKKIKWPTGGHPCVRPYILFYIHSSAILHFFQLLEYLKITQNCLLPKVNQVIG